MQQIYIGLDPGKNNGFAVWNCTTKKLMVVKSMNIWAVMKEIKHLADIFSIQAIVIENPALNKPVFQSKEEKEAMDAAFAMLNRSARKNQVQFAQAVDEINKQMRILATKAQRVGMNKQYAAFLIEFCEQNSFEVLQIRPWLKKMKAEEFKNYTKWESRTNEHGRDAARLVYKLEPIKRK